MVECPRLTTFNTVIINFKRYGLKFFHVVVVLVVVIVIDIDMVVVVAAVVAITTTGTGRTIRISLFGTVMRNTWIYSPC